MNCSDHCGTCVCCVDAVEAPDAEAGVRKEAREPRGVERERGARSVADFDETPVRGGVRTNDEDGFGSWCERECMRGVEGRKGPRT